MQCKSYSHFFSKKIQHICVSVYVNFNESLTNDIVSFEQLDPVHFKNCNTAHICCSIPNTCHQILQLANFENLFLLCFFFFFGRQRKRFQMSVSKILLFVDIQAGTLHFLEDYTCAQQRLRLACASVQSDPSLRRALCR